MTFNTIDPFLRLPQVLACTGLSRATLYRKMKAGTFPRQHQIGERCRAWRQSEVTVWLRNPVSFSIDDLSPAPV